MDAGLPRLDSLRRGCAALFADFTRDRPPWRARSVRWASGLVLLGLALVAWNIVRGRGTELDARAWPLPLRVGLSYIGGFGVGWCMRRFLKLTLLGLIAAAVLFFVLRRMGLEGGAWDALEELVRGGLSQTRDEADALGDVARNSLPSAGGATLGVFLGWFYRVREPEPAADGVTD